jgi:hypothetical protein
MMRKPQTKLAQGVKIFLLAVLILSTFNSCKKDQAENKLSDAQQIQKAKEWYQAQQKKQVTKLAVAVGKESEMVFTPDWENAKVTYINGVASVSTDIKTNLQSKFGIERYFALVVKNDDDGFDYRILNIHSNGQTKDNEVLNPLQLYQTAFTDADLSAQQPINADIRIHGNKFKLQTNISYNNSGKTLLALKKPNTGIKVEAEQCYDAYMVTYVYENGALIDVYQEYLGFEICHPLQQYFDPEHPSPPGNGGDMGSNVINITWGESDDTDISASNTSTSDTTGVVSVAWYCYKVNGAGLRFKSYENVNYRKIRTGGLFHVYYVTHSLRSVQHVSMASEGMITGQDVSPIFANSSDMTTSDLAKVRITFKDRREFLQNKVMVYKYSADLNSLKSWTKAQLNLKDGIE